MQNENICFKQSLLEQIKDYLDGNITVAIGADLGVCGAVKTT